MKNVSSILFLLLVAMFSHTATAQIEHHNVKVGDFDELVVQDHINVKYVKDATRAGQVTFNSTKKAADCLIFQLKKGQLKIEVSEDLLEANKETAPELTVYSSDLHWCENDGDSTLVISSPIKRDEFGAHLTANGRIVVKSVDVERLRLNVVTGKGHITATGKCKRLKAHVLGTATIDAVNVKAQDAECHSTGTGHIMCNVSGELKINGSGSGKVYYKGTPAKIKNHKIIGSLKALPIDQMPADDKK